MRPNSENVQKIFKSYDFAGDVQLTNAAELRLILKLTFGGI